jgi:hypothetical protein
MTRLFRAALDRDPDSAMVAAARSGNEDWISDVVRARDLHDPRETLVWLGALEADWNTVSDGWNRAFQTWVREEPAETAAWVAALPDSPQRDLGIHALVNDLSTDGPDQDYLAAVAWAQLASDRPHNPDPDPFGNDETPLPTRADYLRGILRSWSYDLDTEAERNEALEVFRSVADSFDEATRSELERRLTGHDWLDAP